MERNTPMRKQHTNTTDLLAWPENTPAPSSPPTTASRYHQPAGGQVSGEEEQTQAPSPPPAVPASSEVSGEEEQTQAATSKKRKSCGREKEDVDLSWAQLKDKILRKKRKQMDIDVERLAGSKKKVKFDGSSFCGNMTMKDFVMKEALELLGDEKRAEVEESWKKLRLRENKLRERENKLELELVEERLNLMDCSLSDDYSLALAEAIAEAEAEEEEEEEEGF